jgi:hypothetical protein
MEIGGGILERSSGSFSVLHWQAQPLDNSIDLTITSAQGFSLHTKYRMESIRVNSECPLVTLDQRNSVLDAHSDFLHDLGTSPSMWYHKTLQLASLPEVLSQYLLVLGLRSFLEFP